MSRADLATMTCSVARAIEIVGDQWTQMIVHELFLGSNRFEQLQRHTRASPHILSQRLKRLEAEDIVRRISYSEHPPRSEYRLTEKGRDLWPVILAYKNWGDRWLDGIRDDDGNHKQITLTHAACGHVTNPYLACSACGDPIHAVTATAEISPVMLEERRGQKPSRSYPKIRKISS